MAASMKSTPEDEIWQIVFATAHPFALSSTLQAHMDKLIQTGVQKVQYEAGAGGGARLLEAQDNFRLLVQTMKEHARPASSILDMPEIEASLKGLCPLFPIC